MNKNIEIELKFPLLNFKEVETTLNKIGKFKYEAFQGDYYFNPPHRDFLKNKENVCEWLRLRKTNSKVQINYKDWLPHDQKVKTHCTEYETNIDSFENFLNILKALNFIDLIAVEKTRKIWDIEDVEISIDIVKDLGEFVEIEYKGNLQNIEEARKYLFTFLDKIGAKTGEVDLKGYPYLLLERKKLI